jgi:hypothetical protein
MNQSFISSSRRSYCAIAYDLLRQQHQVRRE